MVNGTRSEANYFRFIVLMMLFLLLAFDRDLSTIYILIIFGDYIWFQSANFKSVLISKGPQTRTRVYLESIAAFGLFLFISSLLVSFFSPQSLAGGLSSTQAAFELLAASTPLLQGSAILTFLGWAILVPIIETNFFAARLTEGLAGYGQEIFGRRISLDRFSAPLWFIIILVSSLFTLFHITAKGLESLPLLITFIFMVISIILVIRHKETKGAILLHILTNSAAVLASLGIL